jgi:hypothetical protein
VRAWGGIFVNLLEGWLQNRSALVSRLEKRAEWKAELKFVADETADVPLVCAWFDHETADVPLVCAWFNHETADVPLVCAWFNHGGHPVGVLHRGSKVLAAGQAIASLGAVDHHHCVAAVVAGNVCDDGLYVAVRVPPSNGLNSDLNELPMPRAREPVEPERASPREHR